MERLSVWWTVLLVSNPAHMKGLRHPCVYQGLKMAMWFEYLGQACSTAFPGLLLPSDDHASAHEAIAM